jgi:hypothetical protein
MISGTSTGTAGEVVGTDIEIHPSFMGREAKQG